MNTALAYAKVAKVTKSAQSTPISNSSMSNLTQISNLDMAQSKPTSNLDMPNSTPISTPLSKLEMAKDMVNSVPISSLSTANSSLDTPNSAKFTPKGTTNALSYTSKPSKAPNKRQDVLYHNDFNAEVFFPTDFNEVDFNIFYTIFYLLKDQKDERVVLDFQQIKDLIYEGRKEKENSTLFYKKSLNS